MRLLARLVAFLSTALAWIGGASFLILSLYITCDSAARYFGLPFTGVADEISAYVLAVAGAWSMAYALKEDGHVRIDLVIGHLGPRSRWAADLLAAGTTMIFAALLAVYGWRQALEAYGLGARSITMLQAPLAIPQAMVAFGFSLLAVQAACVLIIGAVGGARGPGRSASAHSV